MKTIKAKPNRDLIFNKCIGKCAYCGYDLKRNWHIDHLEPVNRTQKMKDGYYRHKETKVKVELENAGNEWWKEHEYIRPKLVFDKMQNPERDTFENSMPSCHSCNITKGSMSLNTFRWYIEHTVETLNKNHYAAYKFAKRYGLVQETIKPIIFYFETLTMKANKIALKSELENNFMGVQEEMQNKGQS